ncbi:MAG TPA: cupin domain-containing protein [Pyrinomonadaceae bacterium]
MSKDKPDSSLAENQRVSLAQALSRLSESPGQRFTTVFEHGSLAAEIFAPRGVDTQQPHTRDEIYIVIEGSGEFLNADVRHKIEPGDFLFVPAGVAHRFENFTDDLLLWVIFYGPEGGELGTTRPQRATEESV